MSVTTPRSPGPQRKVLEELCGVDASCPVRIARSPELGRFLVAFRDISEGEVILKDAPLVVGPQAESAPVCLGCHRPVGLHEPHVCSNCGCALLCGPQCEALPAHEKECQALRNALPNSAPLLLKDDGNWQCILPLRCFVNQPKGLFQLEAHLDARKESGAWFECERNVVKVLHNHGLLMNYPEQAIQKVCGLLDVNCFEVRGPPDETGRSESLRGIYPNAAFMAHSCFSNTHLAIGPEYTLIVKAAANIAAGDAIVFNYTDTLISTAGRRERLRNSKYFSCECTRCTDPTELDTHLSSLRCPDQGCLGSVICTNPLRPIEATWACDKCEKTLDGSVVRTGLVGVQKELLEVDQTNVEAMETLMAKLARSLHPNHAAMLEITQALSGMYREQIMDEGPIVPTGLLKRKLELCSSLLPVIEKLEPPLSRLRGITLYEIASPMVALAKQKKISKVSSATWAVEVRDQYVRCEELLRESARLLLHEPPTAPEAHLAKVALMELKGVRQEIAELNKKCAKIARKKK
ncbi:SET domain-containing protein SmydA-8-like [Neocloeon triangulifer]|uniref:SET domain-containing protein SmydA-8-like n=1 Tax=Neocloeon triangulifer TaxID=2078957 RepID=UPI00286F426A|nr:SET domain-containing protein SmydA-8-like [Neocloeon triangulifer]